MLSSEHIIRQSWEMGGALAAAWQQCEHCLQKGCLGLVDMPDNLHNGWLILYFARAGAAHDSTVQFCTIRLLVWCHNVHHFQWMSSSLRDMPLQSKTMTGIWDFNKSKGKTRLIALIGNYLILLLHSLFGTGETHKSVSQCCKKAQESYF